MNPTSAENQRPGSPHWQLRNIRFDAPVTMASFPLVRHLRSSAIEGYASKTSLYPGETIDFMISLDPPGELAIDIYRMGYYGGIGARHMTPHRPPDRSPRAYARYVNAAPPRMPLATRRLAHNPPRLA